ncbi:MAG: NADH-quinone oxidoreductase subunit J [Sphingomonadaceae bacterium]
MIQVFAFYLFAGLMLSAGAFTILSRNPVHSVLWLIVAFFNAAGLMLIVGAEFIAMLLVIVYVGAVAVLFLFVVMMLDIDFAEMRAGFVRYGLFGAAIAALLVSELISVVWVTSAGPIVLGNRAAVTPTDMPNIEAIGALIYSRYLYIFEAAGFVLLVAMIGAIVLTHRERTDTRGQNISRQVQRRAQDATRNVTDQAVGAGVEL